MRAAWAMLLLMLGCQSDPAPQPAASSASAALPASASATASSAPPDKLTQTRVDAVIAKNASALAERCASPAVTKRVELSLIAEIEPDGSVQDAAVAGGGAALRPVRGCVEDAVRAWTFGPSAGGTVTGTVALGP